MSAASARHILLTGGPTAGHVFPGLVLAQRLRGDWPRLGVTFVGCGRPLERRLVAGAGFDYSELPCRPLPRRPQDAFSFLTENFAGYRTALGFLRRHRVDVVVGLGGYASVPLARAAIRCGVPLVLLEQNAFPGRATRWLARSATQVCAAFEQTGRHLRCPRPLCVTGTPIRPGFGRSLARPAKQLLILGGSHGAGSLNGPAKQLLILGGSNGAGSLNKSVPRALRKIAPRLQGWQIVHQSGRAGCAPTRRLYRELGLCASVVPFLDDMPRALGQTDLAVSRAGGTTLAELAVAGVPAVLLPYPHATDDHQRKNADVFTAAGASLTLDERRLTGPLDDDLATAIGPLAAGAERRAAMSRAILRLARPDATQQVADVIRRAAA